jgi:hypothetical protein
MKKRKRVEPTDNLFAEFDAAIKKMSKEWHDGIRKLFEPLSLPSFPAYNFPDLSLLIPETKPEVRK